jgi:predicted 3-demethylubiquinone-9 3-methyltransferase (glyoxalase superfamily)
MISFDHVGTTGKDFERPCRTGPPLFDARVESRQTPSEEHLMKKIRPYLWFDNQAEEAANFYTSTFKNSKILDVQRFGGPDAPPMMVTFEVEGQEFIALNGGPEHYTFNESVSFFVDCADQAEVDYLWDTLTADGGQPGQCGWLKDRYGLSWQIIPTVLPQLLGDPDPAKAGRALQAMLGMQKIDIQALKDA